MPRGQLSLLIVLTRRLGAAAMLFAASLAAPADVEATCGDYLWMPEHNAGQVHHRAAADEGPVTHSGDRPHPCSGPQCSRAPQAPLVPVPAPVTVDTHDQGLLAAMQPAAGRDDVAWPARDAAARPLIFSSSIFRPPR